MPQTHFASLKIEDYHSFPAKMVRTYKRKTDRADIDEESMAAAIKEVLEENVSVCSSARKYGVNNQTLNSRLRKIR